MTVKFVKTYEDTILDWIFDHTQVLEDISSYLCLDKDVFLEGNFSNEQAEEIASWFDYHGQALQDCKDYVRSKC